MNTQQTKDAFGNTKQGNNAMFIALLTMVAIILMGAASL